MDQEEYYDLYLEALSLDDHGPERPLVLEPLPGESEDEAFIRYLLEQGVLIEGDDQFYVDLERAEELDPAIRRRLEAAITAEAHYTLDQLEKKGLVYTSVDDEGNIIYLLTEQGRNYQKWGLLE